MIGGVRSEGCRVWPAAPPPPPRRSPTPSPYGLPRPSPAPAAVTTQARTSTAISGTSSWTPPACCWSCWSPPPVCRTATAPEPFCTRYGRPSPPWPRYGSTAATAADWSTGPPPRCGSASRSWPNSPARSASTSCTDDPHRRRYEEKLHRIESEGMSATGAVRVRTNQGQGQQRAQ